MKKLITFIFATTLSLGAFAQNDVMFIHKGHIIHEFPVTDIDSIVFHRTQPAIQGCSVRSDVSPTGWLVFMCYNLGAIPNMSIQEQMAYIPSGHTQNVYGYLFQWGRQADGHQRRTSQTTTTRSATNNPGHGNFIWANNSPWDWRNPQNNTLWNVGTEGIPVKTANDPCPPGWRVPTAVEWESILNTANNILTWQEANTRGLLFTPVGSTEPTLFLPAGGWRNSVHGGGLLSINSIGYYHSSTFDDNTTGKWSLLISSSNSRITTSRSRANGMSVRCVAE